MNKSKKYTRIELLKESFKFSSGHFTIFSAEERENIHGHNFKAQVFFDAEIADNGMIFDYKLAKNYVQLLCDSLDEYFLVPEYSKYLKIESDDNYTYLYFAKEKIPFLKRDIKIIPVNNITVEELAAYLLNEFVNGFVKKNSYSIPYVEFKVFSGSNQSANAIWKE